MARTITARTGMFAAGGAALGGLAVFSYDRHQGRALSWTRVGAGALAGLLAGGGGELLVTHLSRRGKAASQVVNRKSSAASKKGSAGSKVTNLKGSAVGEGSVVPPSRLVSGNGQFALTPPMYSAYREEMQALAQELPSRIASGDAPAPPLEALRDFVRLGAENLNRVDHASGYLPGHEVRGYLSLVTFKDTVKRATTSDLWVFARDLVEALGETPGIPEGVGSQAKAGRALMAWVPAFHVDSGSRYVQLAKEAATKLTQSGKALSSEQIQTLEEAVRVGYRGIEQLAERQQLSGDLARLFAKLTRETGRRSDAANWLFARELLGRLGRSLNLSM